MLSSFRAFVADIQGYAGWRFPLLIVVSLIGAALDGLTFAALLPLLAPAPAGTGGGGNGLTTLLYSALTFFGLPTSSMSIALSITGLLVLSLIMYLVQSHLAARVQTGYVANWQRKLLTSFFAANYKFFRTYRPGDLISAVTKEATRLGYAAHQANQIITSALFILVQGAVAIFIAPVLVPFVVVLSAVLFAASRRLLDKAVLAGRRAVALNAALQADTGELIGGAKFIKATGTERQAVDRLDSTISGLEQSNMTVGFDVQLVRGLFEYASGAALIFLLVVGPGLLRIDIANVLVIAAISVRVLPKVTALRQSLQVISSELPAFGAAVQLLAAAQSAAEVERKQLPASWRPAGPVAIDVRSASVEDGGREILDRIDLKIAAGEFIALVGRTGAGKTTLLDCVLGLRSLTSGQIFLDGHLLDSIPAAAWRREVGYLGQEPMLFNSSVGENLRWIRPKSTQEEVDAALHAAAADFAKLLPDGLSTVIGDRGSRLSGGEGQRLALARALLGLPRLLVLDEATSALDSVTEAQVVAAIGRLKGHMTILAITHRPALLAEADRVVTLDNGRVVSVSGAASMAGATDHDDTQM